MEVARAPVTLVVSDRNGFVRDLSCGQVKTIWRRTMSAATWADVDPSFPDLAAGAGYIVADDSRDLAAAVASSTAAVGFLPLAQLRRGLGLRAVRVVQHPLDLEISANSLRKPQSSVSRANTWPTHPLFVHRTA